MNARVKKNMKVGASLLVLAPGFGSHLPTPVMLVAAFLIIPAVLHPRRVSRGYEIAEHAHVPGTR